MVNISMKAMLEAGVHFGHQTRRWNPKMGRYIFGERNNIHIIDLQKTVKELKKAYSWVRDQAAEGKTFLMVGTKKQAQDIIKAEAERIGVPYVSEKWLGGMLTNFETIRRSIDRLEQLEQFERDNVFRVMTKKEVSRLVKELAKLRRVLTGVRTLSRPPDVIFVVDPAEEYMAVAEGRKLKIPIVAVCDTNCDPDLIDHPIPGNDDAARAIKLFCTIIADAIFEGKADHEKAKTAATMEGAEAQMVAGEGLTIEGSEDGAEGAAEAPAESAEYPPEAANVEPQAGTPGPAQAPVEKASA
jgi:small subunit ribosomal protein S2